MIQRKMRHTRVEISQSESTVESLVEFHCEAKVNPVIKSRQEGLIQMIARLDDSTNSVGLEMQSS